MIRRDDLATYGINFEEHWGTWMLSLSRMCHYKHKRSTNRPKTWSWSCD